MRVALLSIFLFIAVATADVPCLADQFTTVVEFNAFSTLVVGERVEQKWWDYTNNRQRVDTMDYWYKDLPNPWGNQFSLLTVNNTVYQFNQTNCVHGSASPLERACLTGFYHTTLKGSIAGGKFDVWQKEDKQVQRNFDFGIVMEPNILPVNLIETDSASGHAISTATYFDYVAEIKDPEIVFKIPDHCTA